MVSFTIVWFRISKEFHSFQVTLDHNLIIFLAVYLFMGVVTMADLYLFPPQSFEIGLDSKCSQRRCPVHGLRLSPSSSSPDASPLGLTQKAPPPRAHPS